MKTEKTANLYGNKGEQEKFWTLYAAHEKALRRLWKAIERSNGSRAKQFGPIMRKAILRIAELSSREASHCAIDYRRIAQEMVTLFQKKRDKLSREFWLSIREVKSESLLEKTKIDERREMDELMDKFMLEMKPTDDVIKSYEYMANIFRILERSFERYKLEKLSKKDANAALIDAIGYNDETVDSLMFGKIFDQIAYIDPAEAFKLATDIVKKTASKRTLVALRKCVKLAAQRPESIQSLLKAPRVEGLSI